MRLELEMEGRPVVVALSEQSSAGERVDGAADAETNPAKRAESNAPGSRDGGATVKTLVPCFRDKTLRSWPKFPSGGRAVYSSIGDALTGAYETDAHFAAYSVPALERRLGRESLRDVKSRADLPGEVKMVAAVFDVDCEAAHRGDPSAIDAWWLDQLELIAALRAKHSGGLAYRTRGGYRIVYRLPEPSILRDDVDAELWSLRYCAWIAYLDREFGIKADAACKDWTRLYRLPHATRDKGGRPERREQIGDPDAIGVWICEAAAEDTKAALRVNKRSVKSPKNAEQPTPSAVGDGLLAHAFRSRQWLGDLLGAGKWAAKCPNDAAHTSGAPFDGSTVLYAPAAGEEVGWLHCSHAHCQGRTVRDALAAFSESELASARNAAGLTPKQGIGAQPQDPAVTGSETARRPEIQCSLDLHGVTNAAEEALAQLSEPRVYVRSRTLVVAANEGAKKLRGVKREADAPYVHLIERPALLEHLSRAADWAKYDKKSQGWKPCYPPGAVVAALAARGAWPLLPRLNAIVETPSMRADGSVLDQPGYDPISGLLFAPRGMKFPSVPTEPTSEQVRQAVADLREVFNEFEWSDPATDLPVVLAVALTLLARPMFEGTCPCFCIDSTTRGSGKGLSAEMAVMIGSGRRPPASILSQDADEQRKALFALTLEGHASILLDNITRPLGGSVLSAVLTSGEIRDRVLGESRTLSAPFTAVMVATGNGMRFSGDFDRRVVVARQTPSVENPEDREPAGGFKHPDLRAWVAGELPRLITAGLTILRAFHIAGRPGHGLKSMGSFESWDGIVRAACIWSEIGDPLVCRDRIRVEADDDRERIGAILTAWKTAFGTTPETVAGAVERAKSDSALALALAEFDSKGDASHPNVTSIGRRLRPIVGRIVAGLRLERVGTQSPIRYRVVGVDEQGLRGLQGFETPAGDCLEGTDCGSKVEWPAQPPATPATPRQRSTGERSGSGHSDDIDDHGHPGGGGL